MYVAEVCSLNSRFLPNCLGEGSDVYLLSVVVGGEQVVQLFGVGQADLEEPAVAVGIVVDGAGLGVEGVVGVDNLSA